MPGSGINRGEPDEGGPLSDPGRPLRFRPQLALRSGWNGYGFGLWSRLAKAGPGSDAKPASQRERQSCCIRSMALSVVLRTPNASACWALFLAAAVISSVLNGLGEALRPLTPCSIPNEHPETETPTV